MKFLVRDITEQKRAEELRDQIERTIRHDLRSPANSAMYLAQLLREGDNLTARQLQLLDYFETSGRQMLDTLNASLDLYKIETGQFKVKAEVFDCAPLVRGLVRILELKSHYSDLRLSVFVDGVPVSDQSRCLCLGQPSLLRSAVQNILINALEASPPDGAVHVELSCGSGTGQGCSIAIRNSGVVPGAVRERFFEKYATFGKNWGTGLGTYSAKMMLQAQGGRITMHTSDADDETDVTLWLPGP